MERPTPFNPQADSQLATVKAEYKLALKAIYVAHYNNMAYLTAGITAKRAYKLYGNLLGDEACQPWDRIIKAQRNIAPRKDLEGAVHGTPFLNCIMRCTFSFKYHITNVFKKPMTVSIRKFLLK